MNPTSPVILRLNEWTAVLSAISSLPSAAYIEVSSNYNILVTDGTINVLQSNLTVTLPSAVGIQGKTFVIKNSGGKLIINTSLSQTINGKDEVRTNIRNTSLTLYSNGSNWIII